MTGLLVSVRDADEARIALEAGVDLIDVKEPSRGSLGAADEAELAAVLAAVAGRVPVSAACGELLECNGLVVFPTTAPAYAKFGLAGCGEHKDWSTRWSEALRKLPPETAPVAVAYADWQTAAAPPPGEVLREAGRQRCAAILVDTFDKARGDLLTHWPLSALEDFIAAARGGGLLVVLGGSLSIATIPQFLPLQPDYVAVRGAVCRGSRQAAMDRQLVDQLVSLVRR